MKELKFFDHPKSVKRLLAVFFICLGILLLVDPFVHKHGDFPWEEQPGFFAAYGFLSYVLLIYIAKLLRFFVKKDETYYE